MNRLWTSNCILSFALGFEKHRYNFNRKTWPEPGSEYIDLKHNIDYKKKLKRIWWQVRRNLKGNLQSTTRNSSKHNTWTRPSSLQYKLGLIGDGLLNRTLLLLSLEGKSVSRHPKSWICVARALHSEFYFLWLLLPAAERHELGFFF